MIKILILTDRPMKWYYMLLDMMDFNIVYNLTNRVELKNKMFHFLIQENLRENQRGAAYAHVILDKQLDEETYYKILMPAVKQRISHHGLDEVFKN